MHALDVHAGQEKKDLAIQRRTLEARGKKLDSTICNLLDNITQANREHVDQRISELEQQKQELDRERQGLDKLLVSSEEASALVSESMKFIGCLEPTLREGALDQRQAALRHCVRQIVVQWEQKQVVLSVAAVPLSWQHNDETTCMDIWTQW